jgi:DNA-3-methyladenine glycosylase II
LPSGFTFTVITFKPVESTPNTFNEENYHSICDELARRDSALKEILNLYGYPSMWTRKNNFETLVHIILEQQVSLASALAALNKLKERIKEIIPENILQLNDEEMRACFVSRQKTIYLRDLAHAIKSGSINLKEFEIIPDHAVREKLIHVKGIGNWTIDVYLMFALQRTDIFPIGDLAAVNALKRIKKLNPLITKEEIQQISIEWQPLRSVATMILWHYYLSR